MYRFKRGFGGRLETVCSAELRLSPLKCRFQEAVVLPAWTRLYPYYLRLTAGRTVLPPVLPLDDPVRDPVA